MKKIAALVFVVLVFVPAAIAGDVATTEVYGGQAAATQDVLGSAAPSVKAAPASPKPVASSAAPAAKPVPAASGGSLPFTGFDLGFVVLAGVGLIVMGGSLRRIARKSQ